MERTLIENKKNNLHRSGLKIRGDVDKMSVNCLDRDGNAC